MVDNNDSLLREVDDELRSDRLKKLWNDYGTYLLAGAFAVVLATGAYQQYRLYRLSIAQEAGARFEAARLLLAERKTADADKALNDIVKSGPAGFAALSRLSQAGSDAQAGKTAEAVANFEAVAADGNADQLLRDFARLQAAGLRLDLADFTEMQNRLTSLTDERNAFRANARELLGLAARKAGKLDDARRLFLQVLGDSKASKATKDRTTSYLAAVIAATQAAAPAQAPAPAPATEAGKPAEAAKK